MASANASPVFSNPAGVGVELCEAPRKVKLLKEALAVTCSEIFTLRTTKQSSVEEYLVQCCHTLVVHQLY